MGSPTQFYPLQGVPLSCMFFIAFEEHFETWENNTSDVTEVSVTTCLILCLLYILVWEYCESALFYHTLKSYMNCPLYLEFDLILIYWQKKSFHGSMVLLNWSIFSNDITIKQTAVCTLVVLEVCRLDKSTDCAFEEINKAVVSNIYQFEIKYSHSTINIGRTHSSKGFLLVGTK